MRNEDIKQYARQKKVKLWQVAMALDMQDSGFSRKLRVELPGDKKAEIMAIIDKLAADQGR